VKTKKNQKEHKTLVHIRGTMFTCKDYRFVLFWTHVFTRLAQLWCIRYYL